MEKASLNTHHLFWPRKSWNYGYAQKLRNHWYCKVVIPIKSIHDSIHWEMTQIPLAKESSCRMVLNKLDELESKQILKKTDPIEKRLDILIFFFENSGNSPTVSALKHQKKIAEKSSQKRKIRDLIDYLELLEIKNSS